MVCCNLCESTRCNECNPPQSCKECYLVDGSYDYGELDVYCRDQMCRKCWFCVGCDLSRYGFLIERLQLGGYRERAVDCTGMYIYNSYY